MRHTSLLAIATLLAFARGAYCDEPSPEIPSDLVLERFAVSKNGDALLVPVRVAEKNCLFVVDTGASHTVFDTALPLGRPIGLVTVEGQEAKAEVKLYRPPDTKVGRTSLGTIDAVVGSDLKSDREVSGHPIYGYLGMDFLGRYVVHIDAGKGELLLLKSPPNGAGVELPISWEPGGRLLIVAQTDLAAPVRFTIDTGDVGFESGDLGVLETRSLLGQRGTRELGKTLVLDLSGTTSRQLIQGRVLKIADFGVQFPIFTESLGQTPNCLGLGFWCRFAATFDFPERKVYLRKSALFDRPDRWNATGLHLWRKSDVIEVASVDGESPAAQAGFKKGDVLVELDGLIASKTSLFDLRNALCNDGKLTCVIRRNSQERRMTINQGK